MRAWLCAAIFLAACRGGGLGSPHEGLAVEPAELAFGGVTVNTTASLELRVRSTGAPRRTLSLSTTPPFFIDAADLTLEGGAAAKLTVHFNPRQLGAAHATLEGLGVALSGEGVALTCAQLSCDDGDACTLDGCEDGACLHAPLSCPGDACHSGRCEPSRGCQNDELPDGTACGASACAWAEVCIAGACERRTRPGAEQRCRYQQVVATNDTTCATTLGGDVRCWGRSEPSSSGGFDELPAAIALRPTRVPTFSSVTALGAGHGHFCAVESSGEVKCGRRHLSPDAGLAPAARKVVIGDTSYALTASGAVSAWRLGPLQPVAAPPRDLAFLDAVPCAIDAAGRLACGATPLLGGALALEQGHRRVYLLTDAGAAEVITLHADGGYRRTTLATAGAVAVGGSEEVDCAALTGGVIDCSGTALRIPAEVRSLTAQGQHHVCALTDGGDVWCWGDNHSGQLGIPTGRPLVPRYLDAGHITSIVAGTHVTEGTRLYGWGSALLTIDGGVITGAGLQHVYLGEVPGSFAGGFFVDDAGVHWRLGSDGSWRSGELGRCEGLGHLDCSSYCWLPDGSERLVGSPCAIWSPPEHEGCVLFRDGGVGCGTTSPELRGNVPLPEPAVSIWVGRDDPEGCALLRSGAVRCWSSPWRPAVAIPGLSPVVRQVVGSLTSGCALSGAAHVQCWGDNFLGQLGREGPASPSAVTVPFFEPIAKLSGGWGTRCVLFESGRAACWGGNVFGEYAPIFAASATPIRMDQ